jgi:cell division protein FtsI (penicillin-binding protein 3)
MKQKQPQKQAPRRRRAFIACLTLLLVPAALTSFVFALQQDIRSEYQKSDLTGIPFSPIPADSAISRGNIFDKQLNQLTENCDNSAVYAHPPKLQQPRQAAKKLADILDRDEAELTALLRSESGIVRLGDNLHPETVEAINNLNMEGVFLATESGRRYPYGRKASHVIGFADKKHGLEGIEFFYDALLQGGPSDLSYLVAVDGGSQPAAADGPIDLILTLDLRVQELIERYLARVVEKSGATGGAAIVMIAESGAVVGMASLPSFDPNRFWDFNNQCLRNRCLTEHPLSGGLKAFLKQTIHFEEIQNQTRAALTRLRQIEKQAGRCLLVPEKQKKKIKPSSLAVTQGIYNSIIERLTVPDIPPADLPLLGGGDTAADGATPLQLLAGFCSLANGGRPITPHLLSMAMDTATGTLYQPTFAKASTPAEVNEQGTTAQALLQQIGKSGPDHGLYFESLSSSAGEDTDLEAILSSAEQLPEGGLAASYLMLSILPGSDGSLVMAIELTDVDLTRFTARTGGMSLPMALLDENFAQTMVKHGLAPPASPTLAMLSPPPQLRPVKTKKNMVSRESTTGATPGRMETMPLVIGKSLRHGLQGLQQCALKISVSGSGIIVAQKPAAGTLVAAGDSCLLQLKRGQ